MKKIDKLLATCVLFLCKFVMFSIAVVALLSVPDEELPCWKWLCLLVLSKIVALIFGLAFAYLITPSDAPTRPTYGTSQKVK